MQKIIISVLILLGAFFVFKPYIFYTNISKENYPEYFYKSISGGDVTSAECLRQWDKYNKQFEQDGMFAVISGPTKKIDYIYDYIKKRCLVEKYIDSNDGANIYVRTEISDLITNKILWEGEFMSSREGLHRTAKDNVNNRSWDVAKPWMKEGEIDNNKNDLAAVPEFRLKDLKNFVK